MSARTKPTATSPSEEPKETRPARRRSTPPVTADATPEEPPQTAPAAAKSSRRAAAAATTTTPKPSRSAGKGTPPPATLPSTPAVRAEVAPPVPAADVVLLDPITMEVPWAEPAAEIPAFLRDRTPRPVAPVVNILGAEPAARPTPAPAASPKRGLATAAPLPETGDGPYYVYVLGDEKGAIHYVGISDNVDRRVQQHLNAACNPRSRWLQELTATGVQPHFKVVETVPSRAAALAAERKWIGHYRTAGHPLTNGLVPAERRVADGDAAAPALVAAPPAPASTEHARPARRLAPRTWLMVAVTMLVPIFLLAAVFGSSLLQGAPPSSTPGPVNNLGSAPLDTPDAANTGGSAPLDTPAPQTAPTRLAVAPGALENSPTPAPQRVGSHSITVQPGQTVADVAALLHLSVAALVTQLGRDTVYAGEVVTRDLYAGDPDLTAFSQGGGPTVEPTVDIYNGKGPDAPVAPFIETTVLASTGLCPPGSARAGKPRDGRVVVPYVPGCAPEDAGQVGPQSQPWVPAPPTTAQGGGPGLPTGSLGPGGDPGPPSNLPATGGGGLLNAAADLVGAVADQAVQALEQTAPPPVSYCADGSVRDFEHRTRSPFVPGCAPLPIGPVQP